MKDAKGKEICLACFNVKTSGMKSTVKHTCKRSPEELEKEFESIRSAMKNGPSEDWKKLVKKKNESE